MSDPKQFVFGDNEGSAVVTIRVAGEHHDPDEGFPRPVYGYTITTEGWEHSASDIRGAQQEVPDLDKAAQTLFALLHDCVIQESDTFPANVRCWAGRYTEEIADLSLESERRVAMAMVGGVLVESEETSFDF